MSDEKFRRRAVGLRTALGVCSIAINKGVPAAVSRPTANVIFSKMLPPSLILLCLHSASSPKSFLPPPSSRSPQLATESQLNLLLQTSRRLTDLGHRTVPQSQHFVKQYRFFPHFARP